MNNQQIMERSNYIWSWALENKRKVWKGFKEIRKFRDLIKVNGYDYFERAEDGGLTIVVKGYNGKILIKARENCYSYGCAMDLLEVYGLFEDPEIYGSVSAEEAFAMFQNSSRKYYSRQNKVA